MPEYHGERQRFLPRHCARFPVQQRQYGSQRRSTDLHYITRWALPMGVSTGDGARHTAPRYVTIPRYPPPLEPGTSTTPATRQLRHCASVQTEPPTVRLGANPPRHEQRPLHLSATGCRRPADHRARHGPASAAFMSLALEPMTARRPLLHWRCPAYLWSKAIGNCTGGRGQARRHAQSRHKCGDGHLTAPPPSSQVDPRVRSRGGNRSIGETCGAGALDSNYPRPALSVTVIAPRLHRQAMCQLSRRSPHYASRQHLDRRTDLDNLPMVTQWQSDQRGKCEHVHDHHFWQLFIASHRQ